jgi:hypothetical protein
MASAVAHLMPTHSLDLERRITAADEAEFGEAAVTFESSARSGPNVVAVGKRWLQERIDCILGTTTNSHIFQALHQTI